MSDVVKVLIVDDASFMVKALTDLLSSDPEIKVIDAARNGRECLEKIKLLSPDVITLDVDMPIMDGLNTVRHIMIESPVPVVMLSSLYTHGDITFDALRLGVVDFLPKPSGAISKDIHNIREQIANRVKIAASLKTEEVRRVKISKWDANEGLTDRYRYQNLDNVICIGTTLGGPNTVINVMTKLSANLPVAVVVIQEIDVDIMPAFIEKFDEHTPWTIQLAEEGMILEQGCCYISSYKNPVMVELNTEGKAQLVKNPNPEKPINELFTSVTDIYKQHTIGVLLTGIGDDGSIGFEAIKNNKGTTLAQSTETCVYPNLTQCAIENGVVDHIVKPNQLADSLETILNNSLMGKG